MQCGVKHKNHKNFILPIGLAIAGAKFKNWPGFISFSATIGSLYISTTFFGPFCVGESLQNGDGTVRGDAIGN